MTDKGHCVMNMEDEDEYVDFYDFSKTYENHPLLIKDDTKAIAEAPKVDEGEESWDDCELEEEDIKSNGEGTEPSFEVVDTASEEKKASTTDGESFEVVENSTDKKKNTGKTREEVFESLNIKKAKLLPSGEVQLGNGKIMGTRKFWYIYK